MSSALAPDISTDDSEPGDEVGLSRSLRIEAVGNILTETGGEGSHRVTESGMLLDAQWDTRHYGAWSLDTSGRFEARGTGSEGGAFGLFRLAGRQIAFDGGWSADAVLGDQNAPAISLTRMQPRFFLPTAPMRGVSTEWRGPSGVQLVAGAGEPGIYEGIAVPVFDTFGGRNVAAGAQWSPLPGFTVGGQIASAHDVTYFSNLFAGDSSRSSTTTGLLTTAWQTGSTRVQANVIDGSTNAGHAFGSWSDASVVDGRMLHSFGAFRIDPGLRWGPQLITNDVQGGYYQFGYQGRRWFTDLGIDQVWSVSGSGLDSTYAAADARYQVSRDIGAGGVVNVRRSQGLLAWALQNYLDIRNGSGIARGQINLVDSDSEREVAVTFSEGWEAFNWAHVSTSAGVERVTGSGSTSTADSSSAASVSINGSAELSARLTIDGNFRWDRTLTGSRASALMANVALTWQILQDWTMQVNYFENRLDSWTSFTVTSPLAPPTQTPIPSIGQRAAFLTIRYQRSAGRHFAPLGGAPGSGSGRLSGTIYLDANDNRCLDAGEAIAPDITVVLDGRYSVLTDSKGRFEFPEVAAGHHVITVSPDNLPLPWTVSGDGRVEVEVKTRSHTDVSIAAIKPTVLVRQPQ